MPVPNEESQRSCICVLRSIKLVPTEESQKIYKEYNPTNACTKRGKSAVLYLCVKIYKASITPPMPVPNEESQRSCICVIRSIKLV